MRLCDSHCHLESPRYDADRDEVLSRAQRAGVYMMISCGSDAASSAQQVGLAADYPGVYAAVGVHGHQANTAFQDLGSSAPDEAVVEEIANLAARPGVVALGELGLDYHYMFSPRETQITVLGRQLALAVALDMPVILHNRESDEDLMRVVGSVSQARGVLHCFLGGDALLDWALARGWYIGVAGPVTYPHMEHLSQQLARVPLNRLLVETDAPYLAPQKQRGRRNEPAFVLAVAEKLGEILRLETERIAEITFANACACFGVPDAA